MDRSFHDRGDFLSRLIRAAVIRGGRVFVPILAVESVVGSIHPGITYEPLWNTPHHHIAATDKHPALIALIVARRIVLQQMIGSSYRHFCSIILFADDFVDAAVPSIYIIRAPALRGGSDIHRCVIVGVNYAVVGGGMLYSFAADFAHGPLYRIVVMKRLAPMLDAAATAMQIAKYVGAQDWETNGCAAWSLLSGFQTFDALGMIEELDEYVMISRGELGQRTEVARQWFDDE